MLALIARRRLRAVAASDTEWISADFTCCVQPFGKGALRSEQCDPIVRLPGTRQCAVIRSHHNGRDCKDFWGEKGESELGGPVQPVVVRKAV